MSRLLPILALLAWLPRASAAPPPGQSALLNGMHDMQAESWMKTATSGCDKGWLTDLQYIGTSGTPAANCHNSATSSGISIIQRLDVSGSESIPKNPAQAPGYASTFASFVSKCPKIHVWIVGNEPNFTFNKSDPDCSADAYAAAYVAVHKKVHALPGHGADLVLATPNSPYSPGCLQSLRMIIDKIKAKGVKPDGFALHAYTQATSGSQLNSGWVTDTKTVTDSTYDECPGGATWNDKWHWHFRIFRDYIKQVIEPRGLTGVPVLITESGNACKPQKGNECYPNKDTGYFQALYAEVDAYNKASTTKTKVRAITPYRWTINDDGTGRDFAIGKRPNLLADLKKAFTKKYAWTTPSCGPVTPTCTDDSKCAGKTICDLGSGKCIPTTTCSAGGKCAPGYVCRIPRNDCVPISRGPAKIAVTPHGPGVGAKVSLDVSAVQGYTNVGLKLDGPASKTFATKLNQIKKIGSLFHWFYGATVGGAGTYSATFTADPGKSTVYGIAYFNVSSAPPKDGGKPLPKDSGKPLPKDSGKPLPKDSGKPPGKDSAAPASDGQPPITPDSGDRQDISGGCQCSLPESPAPPLPLWLLLPALWLARRRRLGSS